MASSDVDPLRFMASDEASRPTYEFLGHWLPSSGSLLDVGCGSGGLLRFARDRGLDVHGVDSFEGNVELCRSQGLDVRHGDAREALAARSGTFDAVSLVHLVEHFVPDEAFELLRGAVAALRRGGVLLVVTPNFADPVVSGHTFWLDPTHIRPYPLDLLAAVCAEAGATTLHAGTHVLVDRGAKNRILRPWRRLRFGREYERMNAVLVARREESV